MLPAPNDASPSSRTCHHNGSQNDDFGSCCIGCTLTSVMPAARNCFTAQSTVAALDGKPETRPQSWPSPISFAERLAREGGALVSPGDFYGAGGASHVRVAVVQPDERIELVATRLGLGR